MAAKFPKTLHVTRGIDPCDPKARFLNTWESQRVFLENVDTDGELVAVYALQSVERLTITKTTAPVRQPRPKTRKGRR